MKKTSIRTRIAQTFGFACFLAVTMAQSCGMPCKEHSDCSKDQYCGEAVETSSNSCESSDDCSGAEWYCAGGMCQQNLGKRCINQATVPGDITTAGGKKWVVDQVSVNVGPFQVSAHQKKDDD